jgi:diacylglycerol kinase
MRKLLREHHISFQHAFAGLVWAVRTQPNFRVHATASLLALFLSWYFRISAGETALIVFAIVLGLAVEMVNTALEAMTDLITTEWRAQAKTAKDVAAGMMLLTAAGTVIVAALIFWPYIASQSG